MTRQQQQFIVSSAVTTPLIYTEAETSGLVEPFKNLKTYSSLDTSRSFPKRMSSLADIFHEHDVGPETLGTP